MAAGPIWHSFMTEALKGTEIESFAKPEPIITEKPVLNGQYQIAVKLKVNKNTGLLATEKTPPELIEERTFTEIHEILWWLDKNNPQGDSPNSPESDSQFNNWETSLQNWLKNNFPTAYNELPKDYDN
jgi:membrane carboxypeptidase/penicillin-binding protein